MITPKWVIVNGVLQKTKKLQKCLQWGSLRQCLQWRKGREEGHVQLPDQLAEFSVVLEEVWVPYREQQVVCCLPRGQTPASSCRQVVCNCLVLWGMSRKGLITGGQFDSMMKGWCYHMNYAKSTEAYYATLTTAGPWQRVLEGDINCPVDGGGAESCGML